MVGVLEMADRDPLVPPAFGHHLTTHLPRVEAITFHHFHQPDLLAEALTHRSAALSTWAGKRTTSISNERLEFVGDRVLGLLIAEWLAERYPRENEGGLGRRLALLVSQPVLAGIAERLGLAEALSVAPSESKAGVRLLATVLADAMEAVIGALYLDGGIEPARRFVRSAWDEAMAAQIEPPKDPKTRLQEWALARGASLPIYRVVSSEGPPHAPLFVVAVTVAGQDGQGSGTSKRVAEVAAATDLLSRLNTQGPKAARTRS
jgi:ribonuclease-3